MDRGRQGRRNPSINWLPYQPLATRRRACPPTAGPVWRKRKLYCRGQCVSNGGAKKILCASNRCGQGPHALSAAAVGHPRRGDRPARAAGQGSDPANRPRCPGIRGRGPNHHLEPGRGCRAIHRRVTTATAPQAPPPSSTQAAPPTSPNCIPSNHIANHGTNAPIENAR